MRILILCQLVCLFATANAADEKPFVIPQKLAGLLAAQGQDGKPAITPEQRAYFDGLNDHLKSLLGNAVESEIITRADHLGAILSHRSRSPKT